MTRRNGEITRSDLQRNSRNGYGQATAILRQDANLYFMRQQVAEILAQAKHNLPSDVEPQLGPASTGLGEIFMYSVEYANPGGGDASTADGGPGWQSDGSYLADGGERLSDDVARLAYLRTVQDWILKPQLKTVPGVADIDSLGGYEKQYVVEPAPAELVHYDLSYPDIAQALQAANLAVGAHYVRRAGEAYLLRADARIKSIDEIGHAVIATRRSIPVTINDVAKVRIGGQFRLAARITGRDQWRERHVHAYLPHGPVGFCMRAARRGNRASSPWQHYCFSALKNEPA
jgi:heavy metal efflux system protein